MQSYQCFGFLDVLGAKQELAVQVAEIDCIKVDDVNFAEAGERQILEKFTADAASSDHQHASLPQVSHALCGCLRSL